MPYDYDELLAAVAPRPVLLYTPKGDRDTTFDDVAKCAAGAAAAWAAKGAASKFVHIAPEGITKMESTEVQAAVNWLKKL